MKRAILLATILLAVLTAPLAHAEGQTWNILLAGGAESNRIGIQLSQDGRSYEISSIAPLEVGGNVCYHPGEEPNRIVCEAVSIASFEVNAAGGNDRVSVAADVSVPTTLRGGPGNDRLIGGAGNDKLIGGAGNDVLMGRGGNDSLFGGPGRDRLFGGPGRDVLDGGPGPDLLNGGSGSNVLKGEAGANLQHR